jgi:hypothetical protein
VQLIHRLKVKAADPKVWKKFHMSATIFWFVAIIPTVVFWSESVLWIGLVSCYANMVGHFGAWQASRAEDSENN